MQLNRHRPDIFEGEPFLGLAAALDRKAVISLSPSVFNRMAPMNETLERPSVQMSSMIAVA